MRFHPEFEAEFQSLGRDVQDELLAHARLLSVFGPHLKRPRADTLSGSRHANMKELRFNADGGVWRVAYAFDPTRSGILLIAKDKAGKSSRRFYKTLIDTADARFDDHLALLEEKDR